MNYKSVFYWLTVADNAKVLFLTLGIIFGIIVGVSTFAYLFSSYSESSGGQTEDDKDNQKMARKWMWWSYPFAILFIGLWVFTPNKKDALLIVAGGETLNFLTTDSTAKTIPHELSNFVVTELKNMAQDAKVNLNIQSQKEKILEEAKNMTAQEVIDKMKTDTTFAKVVLNK